MPSSGPFPSPGRVSGMRENKLWESHRIILPEMREKVARYCRDCRFLVRIQGREEVRWGCVVSVPAYGALQKGVPEIISAGDVLLAVGRAGLEKILARGVPDAPACGLYHPVLKGRHCDPRASSSPGSEPGPSPGSSLRPRPGHGPGPGPDPAPAPAPVLPRVRARGKNGEKC